VVARTRARFGATLMGVNSLIAGKLLLEFQPILDFNLTSLLIMLPKVFHFYLYTMVGEWRLLQD
jgi:hypothetical protein